MLNTGIDYITRLKFSFMKKLYFFLILLTLSTLSFAQIINYGIKAGLNLSTIYFNNSNTAGNYKYLSGFNAGGIVNIEFSNFTIQPGLFYSTKGDKVPVVLVTQNQIASVTTGTNRLNYLELPVNILYNFLNIPQGNLHLGGGPYLGYGVSEKGSVNGKSISGPFTEFARNSDYGLNFIVGARFMNKFLADASYGLGLANSGGNGSTLQNRVISFSVGYLFR